MFDLEEQIRSWRAMVADKLANRRQVIDELESHLREQFERLVHEGRGEEQAWNEVLQRLGTSEQLAVEFHKKQSPRWLAAWCAAAGLVLFAILLGGMASRLLFVRRDPLLAAHVFAVSLGYAAVFAVGFLSLWATIGRASGRWDASKDAALRAAGARLVLLAAAATGAGIALGMWWAHRHIGRWWAWDPRELGGLAVLGWSVLLLRSFRAGAAATQLLVLLGLTGNLVVAVSSFGPMLIQSGRSYGVSTIGMVLGAFIVSQMIAIYIELSRSVSLDVPVARLR